jgi:hypothetical protein
MSVFNIATVRTVPTASAVPQGTGAIAMGGPGAAAATDATGTTGAAVTQQGVFVTPQTIASFAGATLAVSLMWKVSGFIRSGWDTRPWVALVASALVGIVLYLISESDPARGPVATRDRLIGIFVAFINTLVLFSAAVGAAASTQ